MQDKLRALAALIETADQIETVLKANPDGKSLLHLHWHDIDGVRTARLDLDLIDSFRAEKVKLAKSFLKTIRIQIAREKKELGLK